MILLLHAYSRQNRGDGLLVDESLALIKEALGPTPVTVLATHAASFKDLPFVREMPGPRAGSMAGKVRQSLGNLFGAARRLAGWRWNMAGLNTLLPRTQAVLAVGGGYLRTGHFQEARNAAGVMLPQLVWAAHCGKPTLYLPQSIGPLKGPVGKLIQSQLAHLGAVCVRDDRSLQQLRPLQNLHRFPDLAILALARTLTRTHNATPGEYPRIYLVARNLALPPRVHHDYCAALQRLRQLMPEAEPLVQSRGRGNDDAAFYASLGWGTACRGVAEALQESGPGIMVSVRLHGALQALLAGCPTVHLTYERKGFGAYEDLNLMPYLHTAKTFDPIKVAEQVRALQTGAPFWSRIAEAQPRLQAQREQLIALIRHTAGAHA